MVERIIYEIAKDARILGGPLGYNLHLFLTKLFFRPRKVAEQLRQLILCANIPTQELSSAHGERECGYK